MLIRISLLVLLCCVFTSNTFAEDKNNKERQALRKMQLEKRKLEEEKDTALREKSALDEEVKKKDKEMSGLKSNVSKANRKLAELQKELEEIRIEKTKISENLQVTQNQLKDTENKKQQFESKLLEQIKITDVCEIKNLKLYELNSELLDKYKNKGVLGSLLQMEPFTGLKMVEMENAVEQYQDKLEEQRVHK